MEIKFPEVKSQFPILKVCGLLGLMLKREPKGTYRGSCPFCESERTFRVTPEKNLCGCFACKDNGVKDYSGDQLYLIAKVKGMKGAREAALWLLGDVGGTVQKSGRSDSSAEGVSTGGMEPLTYLQHDHPDVELVGFDPEDAQRIGIGFAPRGSLQGNVVVPIRLESGFLVGYIGVQDMTLGKFTFPDEKVVRFPNKTG
jgi:DNA primase